MIFDVVGGGDDARSVLCLQLFYGAGAGRWDAYRYVNLNESETSARVGVFGHVTYSGAVLNWRLS